VGYYNEKLLASSGRKVIVRQSLLSDAEVLICDLDDRYLFTAAANEFKEAPGEPRRAIEAVKRERRRLSEAAEIGAREVRADAAYETWLETNTTKIRPPRSTAGCASPGRREARISKARTRLKPTPEATKRVYACHTIFFTRKLQITIRHGWWIVIQ
jgi:hypothetical protein